VTQICVGLWNSWSTDPLSVRVANVSIVADNWSSVAEEAKFAGSDTDEWDEFGNPMAISGDTLVIAAQWANDVWRSDYRGTCGTVYIYERSNHAPGGWEQAAVLSPDEDADILRYGMGLAIDGDVLAIGTHMACNEQSLHLTFCDSGVVHIFERSTSDPGLWERVAEFGAEGREDWYGFPLSLSGETLAVGAHWEGAGTVEFVPGTVHLYERDGGGPEAWGEVAVLEASDGADQDWFGIALELSGDTIAVGAPFSDAACPSNPDCNSGAVYIFERNHGGPGAWGEVIKIMPEDGEAEDFFGYDLSLDGDTLLVSNRNNHDRLGEAYFFERDRGGENNWGLVKKVTPIMWDSIKVTLQEDVALLSGNGDPVLVLGRDKGGADNWGELAALSPFDEGIISDDKFGDSMYNFTESHSPFVIDGYHFVVGAIRDGESGEDAGAAYVFSVDPCVVDRSQCLRVRRPGRRAIPVSGRSTTIASATLGEHVYEIRQGDEFSWDGARQACALDGMYLASIHSQQENDLLGSLLETAQAELDLGEDAIAWIGLTDEHDEGDWRWVTDEPFTYESWGEGEPDNAHGGEDYAVMYTPERGVFGHWNDVTSQDLYTLYFCETGDSFETRR
jgi:hypothetical protein